ncbi:uncharacterized protein F5147DRAFT_799705 [Suillus discolor]|uniref:Uncharacterized protein n=1 Tax=Suillus discolor TaxID=1912936 RepID=A0A9P7JU65_9AGAM|nr:uncharacterized protein F5147DRAFT_799705 [Suillus discolor]KAG2108411.1 hypothetical protein F5147DRAFT_799705 [Suillus discolor]
MVGKPCDADGIYLPPGAPPPPPENVASDDWTPFHSRAEFEMAEFLYTQNQMSAGQINRLLDLWASTLAKHNDRPPFADHQRSLRDVKWQCFMVAYDGERPENPKPWMDDKYDVWFRDPCEENDQRQWKDFMSGDWAWDQADEIAKDPNMLGSMFVPIILGSDKTTISVGTGNNEYYPLMRQSGIFATTCMLIYGHNTFIHSALTPACTATKEHADEPTFRNFRRQLFHSSLSKILSSLKPGMTTPEVARFGDGHYRRVVYGLGPYIADYEEQVLLTCIVRGRCPKCMAPRANLDQDSLCRCRDYVEALIEEGPLGNLWNEAGIVPELVPFTNDFPRADIYQMISPDILHQLIKGAFKDHLVEWVEKYLRHVHPKRRAEQILDDIDRRIATGRGFKQWTGDDSKALMKVYLPAIEGHVPTDIVRAFRALLEFCYLVRRNIITEDVLVEIEDDRKIFKTSGTIPTFSLPRQHSLKHYIQNIRLFAAPNGLCSSITENKHIKAVKEPWRRSSRFRTLGQMLLINQRLDKISAARVEFTCRGMLAGTCLSAAMNALAAPLWISIDGDLEIDDGPTVLQAFVQLAKTPQWKKHAQTVPALAEELSIPRLPDLLAQFLFQQLHPDDHRDPCDVPLVECPRYLNKILVFNSASSRFYAPSDLSSSGGMRTEHIRSSPSWRNEHSRYDCVFVNTDSDLPGMRGLEVARVRTFFSFKYRGNTYPCAVIHWFDKVGDTADEDTGMWIVSPAGGASKHAVIHVDAIYRAAHLIPVYGMEFLPQGFKCHDSYDAFRTYYVNKYADHHAFEIAF